MKKIETLHDNAMALLDKAIIAIHHGESQLALRLYKEAFENEKEVALFVYHNGKDELTKYILLRSAANLALNCGEYRESEKIISLALTNDVPAELAEEFRDLLEQVSFSRHLELKGITLGQSEIQFSISGKEVGHGMVESGEFIERIDILKRLTYRTAERIAGKPFKEKGPPQKILTRKLSQYISVPRAASFAVTIRFGEQTAQTSINGLNYQNEVIDNIMHGIEIINSNDINEFKKFIPSDPYRRNFIGLTKKMAPDGNNIKCVGFTFNMNNMIKKIPLIKTQKEISNFDKIDTTKQSEKEEFIEITGELSYADKDKRKIKLTDSDKKKHFIIVPEGMLSDIVKPFWEDIVIIKGLKSKGNITLVDINRA